MSVYGTYRGVNSGGERKPWKHQGFRKSVYAFTLFIAERGVTQETAWK